MQNDSQLQKEQREVDLAIVRALVDLLPDDWTKAELDLSQKFQSEDMVSIAHLIRNPDGPSDSLEPSEDLYRAARQLTVLLRRFGHRLKRARYLVELNDYGDWTFTAKYEYY